MDFRHSVMFEIDSGERFPQHRWLEVGGLRDRGREVRDREQE